MKRCNENFYQELEPITALQAISNSEIYTTIPTDWYLIITDIKDSTIAINQGQYKQVNMIGALTIVAILNINKDLDLPFVFGGDGAVMLVPESIIKASKQAMLSVQKTALEAYDMHLRVAVIPIEELYRKKQSLLIAKYQVNEGYFQALLKGEGLTYAEEVLKKRSLYKITESLDENYRADIQGLECRWEAVKTPKDENLTILIKCFNDSDYQEVINVLENILGDVHVRNPISQEALKLSFKDKDLDHEAALLEKEGFTRFVLRQKLKIINLLGNILMKFKLGQWGSYKNRIVQTTDTEKFDDVLRMVVATSYEQTKQLESYLHEAFIKEKLIFGIHKSDASLMTCLIFERHGKHIHFVDGSNGGYALAAKALKKQLEGIKK